MRDDYHMLPLHIMLRGEGGATGRKPLGSRREQGAEEVERGATNIFIFMEAK